MQIFTLKTIVLAVVCVLSTAVAAQKVYRCADSYSQTPCPGGVLIDVADKRTSAQKAQTEAASNRDARSADTMEKARLQQEQKDLAANTPLAKPAGADKAVNAHTSQAKKKKKKVPAYFTGQLAGEKKNQKTQKKQPVEKAASQS